MKFFDNKKAWVEAITDTAIGTVINFPLNLAVLYFAFNIGMSVFNTAVLTWIVFTSIAIVRKYIIRMFFKKKAGENDV